MKKQLLLHHLFLFLLITTATISVYACDMLNSNEDLFGVRDPFQSRVVLADQMQTPTPSVFGASAGNGVLAGWYSDPEKSLEVVPYQNVRYMTEDPWIRYAIKESEKTKLQDDAKRLFIKVVNDVQIEIAKKNSLKTYDEEEAKRLSLALGKKSGDLGICEVQKGEKEVRLESIDPSSLASEKYPSVVRVDSQGFPISQLKLSEKPLTFASQSKIREDVKEIVELESMDIVSSKGDDYPLAIRVNEQKSPQFKAPEKSLGASVRSLFFGTPQNNRYYYGKQQRRALMPPQPALIDNESPLGIVEIKDDGSLVSLDKDDETLVSLEKIEKVDKKHKKRELTDLSKFNNHSLSDSYPLVVAQQKAQDTGNVQSKPHSNESIITNSIKSLFRRSQQSKMYIHPQQKRAIMPPVEKEKKELKALALISPDKKKQGKKLKNLNKKAKSNVIVEKTFQKYVMPSEDLELIDQDIKRVTTNSKEWEEFRNWYADSKSDLEKVIHLKPEELLEKSKEHLLAMHGGVALEDGMKKNLKNLSRAMCKLNDEIESSIGNVEESRVELAKRQRMLLGRIGECLDFSQSIVDSCPNNETEESFVLIGEEIPKERVVFASTEKDKVSIESARDIQCLQEQLQILKQKVDYAQRKDHADRINSNGLFKIDSEIVKTHEISEPYQSWSLGGWFRNPHVTCKSYVRYNQYSVDQYGHTGKVLVLIDSHGTNANAEHSGGPSNVSDDSKVVKCGTWMSEEFAKEDADKHQAVVVYISPEWMLNSWKGPLDERSRDQLGRMFGEMTAEMLGLAPSAGSEVKNYNIPQLDMLKGKKLIGIEGVSHSHGFGFMCSMAKVLNRVYGIKITGKALAPPVGNDSLLYGQEGFKDFSELLVVISPNDFTQALGTWFDQWGLSGARKHNLGADHVRCVTLLHDGEAPNHMDLKFTKLALHKLREQAFSYKENRCLQGDINRATGELLGFYIRNVLNPEAKAEIERSMAMQDEYIKKYKIGIKEKPQSWFRYPAMPINELGGFVNYRETAARLAKKEEEMFFAQAAFRGLLCDNREGDLRKDMSQSEMPNKEEVQHLQDQLLLEKEKAVSPKQKPKVNEFPKEKEEVFDSLPSEPPLWYARFLGDVPKSETVRS